jgi:hypothetical protein
MEDHGLEPAQSRWLHNSASQGLPPEPPSVNPRRKYKRQPTSPQNENTRTSESEDGSDASSMSSSEELELNELASDAGSEADEETGLTGKESRKYVQKQRQNVRLDARIAGNAPISEEVKKLADQHVLKDLLVNAVLIGLWYIFALSISIVRTTSPRVVLDSRANWCFTVQQMDVRLGPPRFPFPFIHHLNSYACPVLPCLSRPPRPA